MGTVTRGQSCNSPIFMRRRERRMELEQFYRGEEWYAYQFFGAHVNDKGVVFRVYAPRAKKVCLIGSFSQWHDLKMQAFGRGGIYCLEVANARVGDLYKFRIYHHDGSCTDKADPYGFAMELRPCSASVIVDMNGFSFTDETWMQGRNKNYNAPMHIYEIHFGSWKAKGDRWYRYDELAQDLIPYLKEMGYTHVEIMPLHEHPLDASWGYQCTGFYAVTSRYGSPNGLKQFVNACHMAGIGVILDLVMAHFAVDDYGLGRFDGDALYEVPVDQQTYSEWGSYNFAHGKGEVASFLKSCANYWLREYHFDGFRMDAVSNFIYKQGNAMLGKNEPALYFLRTLNTGLHNLHPGVILIAEDSSDYPKVTAPVEYGGLGFDYKWDLGFMHDTLRFFAMPMDERRQHYGDLFFSMHYFYNELYLLPFSHDEVVHGKKTILDKMYGTYEEKFAQCRAMYTYMMTHPGKKLNFMGNEIGQFREWAEYRPQDFETLQPFPMHEAFKRFFKDISNIYLHHAALHVEEYNRDCFSYLQHVSGIDLVYAYIKRAGGEQILCVFNFSDVCYDTYRMKMDGNHMLCELMNTSWDIYGGDVPNEGETIYVRNGWFDLCLKPFSARLFIIQ